MKRILYISDLNEAAPLYHSQILPQIAELRKYFDVTMLKMTKNEDTGYINKNFHYGSIKGDYSYYLAAINFFRQKKSVNSFLKQRKFDLVYSRGLRGGLVGSFIKRDLCSNSITLLNDTRGFSLDGMHNNFINRTTLFKSDRFVFTSADILFLVSTYLKDSVCSKYHFDKNNAHVFPTFVVDNKFDFKEENRVSMRKDLHLSDSDIVLLYSGNLANYQNVEFFLEAYSRSTNPNLKMIFLTNAPEINSLVKKYQIPADKIRVRSASYADIEKYYHAADFGLLIRDNTVTNKCAAPTKFSEYLNAGLSIIINDIESDYVRQFEQLKPKGFLLPKKEDLTGCLNSITKSDVKRNNLKINTLAGIVKDQRDILKTWLNTSRTDKPMAPARQMT